MNPYRQVKTSWGYDSTESAVYQGDNKEKEWIPNQVGNDKETEKRKRMDSRLRGNDTGEAFAGMLKEEKTKNMGETPMLRKTTAGGGCAT